jgi:hypothetical protein
VKSVTPHTHFNLKLMFYVTRDSHGTIETVSKQPAAGREALDDQHPELVNFWGGIATEPNFGSADAEFVRVLEDLIDTLITNNVIRHTDLPAAAQHKLVLRRGLRNEMQGALNLLDGDDQIL